MQVSRRTLTKSEINKNIKNTILRLGVVDGDTIVDIGCGDGSMDFEIFKLYPSSYFILKISKKRKLIMVQFI